MWTTGQQGKWINLYAPRQSADLSSLGLRAPDEPECAIKKPRRRLNWPIGKSTDSLIRWQPTKSGNCASEGFSKAQKSFAISEVATGLKKFLRRDATWIGSRHSHKLRPRRRCGATSRRESESCPESRKSLAGRPQVRSRSPAVTRDARRCARSPTDKPRSTACSR